MALILKTVSFFMLSLMLLIGGEQAYAASVGQSIEVNGDAWVLRDAHKVRLHTGFAMQQRDIVVTGANGSAKLLMQDGSQVFVSPRSRLSLQRYAVKNKKLISAGFNMFWGKVRFFVSKFTTSRSSFGVRTSTAVLGVRGTVFTVNVARPAGADAMAFNPGLTLAQLPAQLMSVALASGSVALTSISGAVQVLEPGTTATVNESGGVSIQPTSDSGDTGTPAASDSGDVGGISPSTAANVSTSAAISATAGSSVTQGVTITTPPSYGFGAP